METNEKTEGTPKAGEKDILAKIAARVRRDSNELKRLTSVDLFTSAPGEAGIPARLAEMTFSTAYQDIKPITAANGAIYLYSNISINRKEAEKLAWDEEVRSQIVGIVRMNSEKKVKLTSLNSLGAIIPGAEADKIDLHLGVLMNDERYKDIRLVTAGKSNRYLFCETFMTITYARVLARAEANDPVATIVETVREESRVYPRPTNPSLFEAPIFRIDADHLDRLIAEVFRRPEYKDIKEMKASTGVRYLYSDLYLKDSDWVRSIVEWEQVGSTLNP